MKHERFRDAEILPDPGAILLSAGRCWRAARDRRLPVLPSLYQLLSVHDQGMLAPVFDGLMALYEAVLGRPIVTGEGTPGSDDERRLLGLIAAPATDHDGMMDAGTMAAAFDGAVRLTRIMMLQALGRPFDGDLA